ncbi:MAG: guanylate kinase [Candidatus Phytoplasma asteris]|nr:hypothetical protein ['Chrysanthemum coronarium' phytoplasma]TKA88003.1 MAG: hypothetical protein PLY_2230 [Periwinkle leaf yellowing phytoplasma]WEX19500.1 MAG: guanylate kinase [Candidatus Phytoplasma asteris]
MSYYELSFYTNKDEMTNSNVFKYLPFPLIVFIITALLSCFVFGISKFSAPICLWTFGTFVGMLSGLVDTYLKLNLKKATQTGVELPPLLNHLFFIIILSFLFIIVSNFAITTLLYYKKFKKQNNQQLINKFAFVVFNFFVITMFYVVLFCGVAFFWLASVSQLSQLSSLFDPYFMLGLLFVSLFISWASVYIAGALVVFDYIIEKQVDKKYEASMAFALCLLVFWPLIKALWNFCKKED